MKTANQLTFTTYEASLKLKPNDPIKIIFDNIDWSFIHPLANGTFTNFRDRLGEDIFYEILHQLIARAIVLKVITGVVDQYIKPTKNINSSLDNVLTTFHSSHRICVLSKFSWQTSARL